MNRLRITDNYKISSTTRKLVKPNLYIAIKTIILIIGCFHNHNTLLQSARTMGTWILEVGRMAMYVSFPVVMFHYFNQPEYYEKWVTDKKREIYPPEEKNSKDQIQQFIRDMREQNDQKLLSALDAIEQRR